MNGFLICPGVTMWTLNPMNHALRNDYIANLLGLAVTVLPKFYKTFNGVKVLSGFISRANCDQDDLYAEYMSSGCGITVSIPMVTDSVLMDGLMKICEPLGGVSLIIKEDILIIIKDLNLSYSTIKKIDDKGTRLIYSTK